MKFTLVIALIALLSACTTTPEKTTTLSGAGKARPIVKRPGVQINVPWKKAAIDAGDHVVVTDIPRHWPDKPHMRYTKRDGKSIEFYPPGGGKTGDRIIVSRIFTSLSPQAFSDIDLKRLQIWCGARNTSGKTVQYHPDGISVLSLCGSVGGASGVSSSLNKEGETLLYRLAIAPGGLYRIAHVWPGKAFDVRTTNPALMPASPSLIKRHRQKIAQAFFCKKGNPLQKCLPFID